MLATISALCSWLGPHLPDPERVAQVAVNHAGQALGILDTSLSPPDVVLDELGLMLEYLSRFRTALDGLTRHDPADTVVR